MKKFFVMIFVICMLASLTACDNATDKIESPDNIAVYGVIDESVLNSDVNRYAYTTNAVPETTPEQQKIIEINGMTFSLSYLESKRILLEDKICNVYSNEDETVRVWINSETQKIRQFYMPMDIDALNQGLDGEQAYIDWCKEYLEVFGASDLEDYVYSCYTIYQIEGDNGVGNSRENYFYDDFAENETLFIRSFTFRKTVNGVETSDYWNIILFSNDDSILVRLNNDEFNDDMKLEFSVDEAMEKLGTFVSASLSNKEKTELHSYSKENGWLMYVDGKLCYYCRLSITTKQKNSDQTNISSLSDFLYFIE